MKPRTLALLERLERRAVDEHRQELAEAEQRIQAASTALTGMRAARPIETAIGWGMGQGAAPVAAYWAGTRAAEAELLEHLARLRRRREEVAEAMRERLAEARRYELLAEAEQLRRQAALARAEQAVIDEVVLIRRAADGSEAEPVRRADGDSPTSPSAARLRTSAPG